MLILTSALMASLSVLADVRFFHHLAVDFLLVFNCFIWSRHRKGHLLLLLVFPAVAVIHYSLMISGALLPDVSDGTWTSALLLLALLQSVSGVGLEVYQQLSSPSETLGVHHTVTRISTQVEILYASLCSLILIGLLLLSVFFTAEVSRIGWYILTFLLVILEILSLIRTFKSDVFLVLKHHESKLLQCAPPSQLPAQNSGPHVELHHDVYAEIYDRLTRWFDEKKPYLQDDLSLLDAAREIYTNKVYISRAVSKFSGKNFCQFVNYYRVRYAKQTFLDDPTLRVSDLSVMSGFHNPVSFNMAFQMFEHMTPGEWCNDQRSRLSKMKK